MIADRMAVAARSLAPAMTIGPMTFLINHVTNVGLVCGGAGRIGRASAAPASAVTRTRAATIRRMAVVVVQAGDHGHALEFRGRSDLDSRGRIPVATHTVLTRIGHVQQ